MGAIIVFLIFGGFGLGMLYVGVTQHLEQKRLLASARPVEAEITRSEVHASGGSDDASGKRGRGGSTITYRPEVEFRYQLAGSTYTSDRIYPTIIARTHATHDRAAEVVRPFVAGTTVKAFVDESQPEKAFLIAESGAGPMVFMILGVALVPLAWAVGRLV
jgi:hypothetical protein